MNRPPFPHPRLAGARFQDQRVRELVGRGAGPPHAGEDREGVDPGGPLAVPFEEGVPEDGDWAEDAAEEAGAVGEGGEGVGEADEVGGDELVLLQPFDDDLGVQLVQVGGVLAGSEEGDDGGQLVGDGDAGQ